MLNEQQFYFMIFKVTHTGIINHAGAKVLQNLILPPLSSPFPLVTDWQNSLIVMVAIVLMVSFAFTKSFSSLILWSCLCLPQSLHDFWELTVNCCDSWQSILMSFPQCKIMVLSNSNIVNNNRILKLQNGIGTVFSCLKCGHNLISRKIIHCLYGDLARTTKNESKMQENLKLRTPTQGFYCTCVYLISRLK
jgi:hypothetical protein